MYNYYTVVICMYIPSLLALLLSHLIMLVPVDCGLVGFVLSLELSP